MNKAPPPLIEFMQWYNKKYLDRELPDNVDVDCERNRFLYVEYYDEFIKERE